MARVVLISLYDEFCLGPRYISSVLRQAGHETSLVLFKHCLAAYDTPAEKAHPEDHLVHFYSSKAETDALLDFIRQTDPLWIGFSFMSFSSGLAVYLTQKIREVTNTPIVWGGVDTTVNREWSIEHADIICISEGEYAALELTDALEGKRELTNIQNLWVKKDGQIYKNEVRPLIQDLDTLPFPDVDYSHIYHIDQNTMRVGVIPEKSPLQSWYVIMTSRGCPYRCSYCIHGLTHELLKGKGKYLRRRTVENVIEELKAYKKYRPNTDQILFYDDVFTFDRKWIDEFADAYKREIDLPFWVYTYPEICDEVILARLKEIGLMYVKMGIQSGSDRVMNEVYDRRLNQDRIMKAAQTLQDLDIYCVYDMLIGIPLETEEDLRNSLEILLQIPRPYGLNVWPIIFYRNYNIAKKAEDNPRLAELVEVEGANCAIYPQNDPYLRYWIALMSLVKYPQVPIETIRTLLENQALREDPTPLEAMEKALFQAVYIPNLEFQHKDKLIEEQTKAIRTLRQENEQLQVQISHLNMKKGLRLQRKVEQMLGRAG